jgi:thiamine-phosphate pyrophosphorylase
MGSVHQLASLARRLNQEAGAPSLPALYFFTDPQRTPDPVRAATRMPSGSAIVYRHFGAGDRIPTARRLARACGANGLILLIAADPELARRVGADGVHWPEQRLPEQRTGDAHLVTASAHSLAGVARAAAFGADACVLAPVFPTRSSSGRTALGLFRASQIARAARIPVIALGGVSAHTARRLAGRGFAGFGAVDALLRA